MKTNITHIDEPICTTDLSDVTFLVPLRIDSPERKENINALIKYTFQKFKTKLIVLEADSIRKFYPEYQNKSLHYKYIIDNNEVFHRTKWINQLISMAKTTYVAIWDSDAISPSQQILNAVKSLRSGLCVMAFPYDGRFYSCDKMSSDLFKKYTDIEILTKHLNVMRLMHGYHSVGGAFIVDKVNYLKAGGENENIYGWGPEDTERVKRMEVLGLPVSFSPGVLFHLYHPKGKNSWFANPSIERMNRLELLKTCSTVNNKINITSE